MCLLDKAMVLQDDRSSNWFQLKLSRALRSQSEIESPDELRWCEGPREWRPTKLRYYKFASKSKWISVIIMYSYSLVSQNNRKYILTSHCRCLLMICGIVLGLERGLVTIKHRGGDADSFVHTGFGTMNGLARSYLNQLHSELRSRSLSHEPLEWLIN